MRLHEDFFKRNFLPSFWRRERFIDCTLYDYIRCKYHRMMHQCFSCPRGSFPRILFATHKNFGHAFFSPHQSKDFKHHQTSLKPHREQNFGQAEARIIRHCLIRCTRKQAQIQPKTKLQEKIHHGISQSTRKQDRSMGPRLGFWRCSL